MFRLLTSLVCLRLAEAHKASARAALRLARVVQAYALGLSICLLGASTAQAPSAEALNLTAKAYAKIKLNDKVQFHCLNKLYKHESHWNYKAKNGDHYGIPQGKSIYLKTANQYQQINWGLKYIKNRYSTPCNAYRHWTRYNWH